MAGFDSVLAGWDDPAAGGTHSWRTPLFSDWQLQLGDQTYSVHRADLCEGDRGSDFFLALFQRWTEGASKTDLTDLLPRKCWPVFEQVLDFFYEGVIFPQSDTAVLLFKVGHILGMRSLAKLMVEYLKRDISPQSAFTILEHSLELGPGLEGFEQEAISMISSNLGSYEAEAFNNLPLEAVLRVLQHDCLCATASQISAVVTRRIRECFVSSLNGADGASSNMLAGFVKVVLPKDAVFWLTAADRFDRRDLLASAMSLLCPAEWPIGDLSLLSYERVVDLLNRDDLYITSEDQIYDVICSYLESNQRSPEEASNLWCACRFFHMSIEKICNQAILQSGIPNATLKTALAARALQHEKGPEALEDFLSTQLMDDSDFSRRQFARRRSRKKRARGGNGGHHISLICDTPFDENGVLYYIATFGGAKEWRNPHQTKNVVVASSALSDGALDAFVLRPGCYGDDSELATGDGELEWVAVDLGPNRRLNISSYCIRSGQRQQSKLRHWDLQGAVSLDVADPWVTLREHRRDRSLKKGPHTVATWSVENAPQAFRYFRILHKGKNAYGTNHIFCSGIELYGELWSGEVRCIAR